MRTIIVSADNFTVTVRGRTRRTSALESEYLLTLKQSHPDMKELATDNTVTTDELVNRAPRGWSLAGSASQFRILLARCSKVDTLADNNYATIMHEPFGTEQLVYLFNHYLDAEQLPDRSDLWSQIEDAIVKMEQPEIILDPNVDGNKQTIPHA